LIDGSARNVESSADAATTILGERPLSRFAPLLFVQIWRRYGAWFRRTPVHEAHARAWPAGFEPRGAPVFAHNERLIPHSPLDVFAALVDAELWPRWYPNARDVSIGLSPRVETRLEAESRFSWVTFGAQLKSAVEEYEQAAAIAWRARGGGTIAFHRWILEPADDGTRVITEECQVGFVPRLIAPLMNRALHASHELWLRQLERKLGAQGVEQERPSGAERPSR
jgi:uncharacterized protein YndB with AHSA1/START domain